MTTESSREMGTPEEVAEVYSQFIGRVRPTAEPPDGFTDWVRNLHDVFLNVETAWMATVYVPPSPVEHDLAHLGGSREQRLARFLARDLWVLWEAWDRRPQFHGQFAAQAPEQVDRLRALEQAGRDRGWFKRIRAIRDYMNHRDKREYDDRGRDDLDEDATEWLFALRGAFSELILAVMGLQSPAGEPARTGSLQGFRSDRRAVAAVAVDQLLVGTTAALQSGSVHAQEAAAQIARAFATVVSGSTELWSETLTALIRRAVVAWSLVEKVPELRDEIVEAGRGQESESFFVAITTPSPTDSVDLAGRSALAVERVMSMVDADTDLCATIAMCLAAASLITVAATILEPDDLDLEDFVEALGQQADGLRATD